MKSRSMNEKRRLLLGAMLGACALRPATARAQAHASSSVPVENQLEPGDLLWPKSPGAFVPYNSEGALDYAAEKREWIESKRRFIASVNANPAALAQQKALAQALTDMEFREFQSWYLADRSPSQPDQYGSDQILYIGHIAIVENLGQGANLIEALMGKGVVRRPYASWLKAREGQIVWHARLKDRAAADRSRIAQAAAEQLAKPYEFWNFNLLDTSGFYCSKLVWYSVMKTMGIALDDKSDAQREFWYSPKRVMKSKHIYFLNNPGAYTWR